MLGKAYSSPINKYILTSHSDVVKIIFRCEAREGFLIKRLKRSMLTSKSLQFNILWATACKQRKLISGTHQKSKLNESNDFCGQNSFRFLQNCLFHFKKWPWETSRLTSITCDLNCEDYLNLYLIESLKRI